MVIKEWVLSFCSTGTFFLPLPSSLHSISTPRDDPARRHLPGASTLILDFPVSRNCESINSVHYKLHYFRHSTNSNTKRSNTELEPTKLRLPLSRLLPHSTPPTTTTTKKKSMTLSLKSLLNFTKWQVCKSVKVMTVVWCKAEDKNSSIGSFN